MGNTYFWYVKIIHKTLLWKYKRRYYDIIFRKFTSRDLIDVNERDGDMECAISGCNDCVNLFKWGLTYQHTIERGLVLLRSEDTATAIHKYSQQLQGEKTYKFPNALYLSLNIFGRKMCHVFYASRCWLPFCH